MRRTVSQWRAEVQAGTGARSVRHIHPRGTHARSLGPRHFHLAGQYSTRLYCKRLYSGLVYTTFGVSPAEFASALHMPEHCDEMHANGTLSAQGSIRSARTPERVERRLQEPVGRLVRALRGGVSVPPHPLLDPAARRTVLDGAAKDVRSARYSSIRFRFG